MAGSGEWRARPWEDYVLMTQRTPFDPNNMSESPAPGSPYSLVNDSQWYNNNQLVSDPRGTATGLLNAGGLSQDDLNQRILQYIQNTSGDKPAMFRPQFDPATGQISQYYPGETGGFADFFTDGGKIAAAIAAAYAGGQMGFGDGGFFSGGTGAGFDPSSLGSWDVPGFTGGDASWGVNSLADAGGWPDGLDWNSVFPENGQFSGGTMSNADIMSQIGANPSLLEQVKSVLNTPGTSQAKSALSKILSGNGNSDDFLKVGGSLASTLLGMYGANRQQNSLQTLSNQYAGYGAPYRAMLASSYADPAAFLANSPDIKASVDQGTSALARSLSTQGNPTGSGAALGQLQNYATQSLYGQLGNERNRLANFGGLSNFNAAAPQLATQSINSQGNLLNAIGSGISSITNPPNTLEQALNALNANNFKLNSGTGLT